jgi:hypothetical protein
MRSMDHGSISAERIHDHAAGVLQHGVKLKGHGSKCTLSTLIAMLFFAAARRTSVFNACGRLRDAPTYQGFADALKATLPGMRELERRLNRSLAADLPKSLSCKRRPLAIDITEIPYHGKPLVDEKEIRRGQPKCGTSHFHAYATLYVVRSGQRFTVAMTYVWKGDSMRDILQRLLRRASQLGIRPWYLLLDRGFYSVETVRYLQAARYPFLVPVAQRGRRPKKHSTAKTARRFWLRKRSGWDTHQWFNPQGIKATVQICISCGNYEGRRKRRGRKTWVYAYWGLQPGSTKWVRDAYRKRFGIETSYRQMNQARIRTCTRNPKLRLLFVGVALILRNAWVWFHFNILARHLPGGGLEPHLERLRLDTLLLYLQRYAEALLGCNETAAIQQQE